MMMSPVVLMALCTVGYEVVADGGNEAYHLGR